METLVISFTILFVFFCVIAIRVMYLIYDEMKLQTVVWTKWLRQISENLLLSRDND